VIGASESPLSRLCAACPDGDRDCATIASSALFALAGSASFRPARPGNARLSEYGSPRKEFPIDG